MAVQRELAGGASRDPRRRRPRQTPLPLRAHVEQVDEEVVRQRLGPVGEHAVAEPPVVGVQHPHAADQHRHLGRGQRQQVGPVDQRVSGDSGVPALDVVAEPVERSARAPRTTPRRSAPARRRCGPARTEPSRRARRSRRLLDGGAPAEHDQVGERDPLAAGLAIVEVLLDPLERLPAPSAELGGLVDVPVLLRARGGSARRWRRRACRCRGSSPPPPRRCRPAGRRTDRRRGSSP